MPEDVILIDTDSLRAMSLDQLRTLAAEVGVSLTGIKDAEIIRQRILEGAYDLGE